MSAKSDDAYLQGYLLSRNMLKDRSGFHLLLVFLLYSSLRLPVLHLVIFEIENLTSSHHSSIMTEVNRYAFPRFTQLTVTSYYAASSSSQYGISLLTRQIEEAHTSTPRQEKH
ncbi:hypothetical protein KSS87_017541 [Heliosperma pusillum]|nr:hypothetical protein KSS87_007409 [Heliosperma pusillum]KAH9623907.1 hypothetical protein KSS87_017541 [Heliosperma pusillum]